MSSKRRTIKLTPYPTYAEREVTLEECPNCSNTRMSKTPRRKSGPGMFHCRRCGYLTNIDLVNHTHWMLGHVPA